MKKFVNILNKLRTVAQDMPMGACCCKDKAGNVVNCYYSSGNECGQSYEAWANNWICTFYENYPCNEVCFGANGGSNNSGSDKPSMIDEPAGAPLPPAAPQTSPNDESMIGEDNTQGDCQEKVKPLLECLDRMNVSNSSDLRDERTRLQKLVKAWANFRCPQIERTCSGTGGTSGPVLMDAYSCYCNIHREYFAGLKLIVEEFCSQQPLPLTGKTLKYRLNELCRQFKLARASCRTTHGVEDPIRDVKNGTKECGFSN